ncbi:MAG TPA: sigma 54-interacting transcriptional regulator, partial [Syntrophales bacterium]|nr:sigma 54-interacting transcriptional regulator [Syntrophales bacterium]
KLLRVIQERNFERIGGLKTINADVRIIAATHQDLERAVEEKRFREDLFYRINVIPIHMPPLRERGPDIAILANHFLRKFNKSKKKNVNEFDQGAMKHLLSYAWPGNVRELENLVEMLVVVKGSGRIEVSDLPGKIVNTSSDPVSTSLEFPEDGFDFNEKIESVEREYLLKALEKSGGIKNQAAKLLKLNRTTLVEKLKRFNIRGT